MGSPRETRFLRTTQINVAKAATQMITEMSIGLSFQSKAMRVLRVETIARL
jgi:hypothetical protein